MSEIMRVETSFGGTDAETGETFEAGSHGQVQMLPSAGAGLITE